MNKSAYSVIEWCKLNGISRGHFYNLDKIRKAPRCFYAGTRRLISAEADLAWRRERKAEAVAAKTEGRAMITLALIVKCTERVPGRRHVHLYDVALDGEIIASDSSECDAARALEARGIAGVGKLIDSSSFRHRGTVNIRKAARLTVREDFRGNGPRLVKWRAFPKSAAETCSGSQTAAETNTASVEATP
jgi:hypothetical protein